MKNIITMTKVLMAALLAVIAIETSAQTPTYSCVAKNDTLINSTVYQFDIYIYRTGTTDLYLNNYQFSYQIVNTSGILNGGTLTGSYVSGSSDLPSSFVPSGVSILTSGGLNYVRVNGVAATTSGTLVPVTGLRIGTFRVTNSVAFGQSKMNLAWWNAVPATTSIRAIVPPATSGTVVVITNMSFHSTSLTDPVLNLAVSNYNMTGGGTYCTGTSGTAIGLSSSETGVIYRLIKNSIPSGSNIPGSGSSLNFGNQPAGTYTCSAYRKATYITGNMSGSAVSTEIIVNPVITGSNSICKGTSGVFYKTQPGMSNYLWNVSAGGTITGGGSTSDSTITVTWNTDGAQSVSVNYTNSGCTASVPANYPVTVHSLPVTMITGPNSICVLSAGNIYSTTTGLSGYAWKVSSGGMGTGGGTSSDDSITITWNSVGAQWVKVIGTNGFGCIDSTTLIVNVRPNPVASFTPSDTSLCLNGNSFTFNDNSIISSGTFTNKWYFGDGNSSANTSPVHSYISAGTYPARLVITSDYGCKDSTQKNIYVRPHPASDPGANDTLECLRGNHFIFTNNTTIISGTFTDLWKFGDGSTSTAFAPSHSYTAAGVYLGTYVATSDFGCKDSTSQHFYVMPHPVSAFSVSDTSHCLKGNNFVFTNNTTIPSGTYNSFWNFGDLNTSTTKSPNHTYTSANIFSVKLVTTSNYGCTDSISRLIYVRPHATTAFNINDSSICFRGNNFIFTNTSSIASGMFSNLWRFGDNTTSVIVSPAHSYSAISNYTVWLVTTSDFGCKDSISKTMFVRPHPVASFTTFDTSQCLRGNNFVFANSSYIISGTYTSLWKFGDGTTSTIPSLFHSYPATGKYTAKLIVTSNFGCKDSTQKDMYIKPHPVSSYTPSDTSRCLNGNFFTYTNTSTIPTGTFSTVWYLGDGLTSTFTSPTHFYSTEGTYKVKLVNTSDYGCKDSITKNIYVRPHPASLFAVGDTSLCLRGNNFKFYDYTTISSGTFTSLWKFGDGNTSSSVNPSHNYSSVGSYGIQLITTSNYGCKDSISGIVHVKPHPAASFTVNDSSQCLRANNFAFTNTSSISSGTYTDLWYFGDSDTSTTSSPNHNYLTTGTYLAKLVLTSDFGCKDSSISNMLVRPHPVTSVTVNDTAQCLVGNNFIFTNNTTISSDTFTSLWKFGDGDTSTAFAPVHSYMTADTFHGWVITTSTYGCQDSIDGYLYAWPHAVASFSVNDSSQCQRGNNFIFTNNTSILAGTFTNHWDFGDFDTSTSNSPAHIYLSTGTYPVKLFTTSDFGCTDSTIQNMYVNHHPVTSFYVSDTSMCQSGNNFNFYDSSTISTGGYTVLWKFGDNSSSILSNPSHYYPVNGVYLARLVTTSGFGCEDSSDILLYVRPHPLTGFSVNDTMLCLNGNNFIFSNNTSINAGTFTSLWDFGDLNTSVLSSPVYSYTTAGNYLVKLVATSDFGCKDSTYVNLYVKPHPVTLFNQNDTSLCLNGNNFIFTNNSSIGSGSYTGLWSFGDGSSATTYSPSHNYLYAGDYPVKLVNTSDFGCKDSIIKTMHVRPHPVASWVTIDTSLCLRGNSFVFANSSFITSGSFSSLWKFGDLTTSTSHSLFHSYPSAGVYQAWLVATSNYGCTDSASKTLYVRPHPATNYSVNDTAFCLPGNNFIFTNNSSITSGTFSSLWNFGDGNTSTATSTSHSYSLIGDFKVQLTSISGFGCRDSVVKTMHIVPFPNASFNVADSSLCHRGNNFLFNNTTSVSSGTYNSTWNFGDLLTSTLNSPAHSYLNTGTYNVKLVVTSGYGCKDSITKKVYVREQPVALYTVSDTSLCQKSNAFFFTNNSTIPAGTYTSLWRFGDLNTSTSTSPSHVYLTDGNFAAWLTVTSNYGCKDSMKRTIHVRPHPVVAFDINDTLQCLHGNKFIFTNKTTISSGSFSNTWKFGDGVTGFSFSPQYTYTKTGFFTVNLTTTSTYGCKSSVSQIVHVLPSPVVNLGGDKTVYDSQTVSLDAGAGFDSYAWSDSRTTRVISIDTSDIGYTPTIYWVKVMKDGCPGYDSVLVTFLSTTGINDPEFNFTMAVYPNPVSSVLNIKLEGLNHDVVINLVDLNGKQLKTMTRLAGKGNTTEQLDISELAKGIYYLEISNEAIRKTVKVVKY